MSKHPVIRHALLMAAGRGMRMRPLTDAIPKAMAPYNGETLIAAGLKAIKQAVPLVHVTVGYKRAMLAEHLMHIGVSSIFNTEGHSNTWWMYHTVMRHLDEPVFVLTCDNLVKLDFSRLARDYFETGAPACMVVPVKPVPGLEGDFIDHVERRVTRIQREDPTEVYCSGIQILNPHRIASTTEEADSYYGVWAQLMARNQLYMSSVYPDRWFAVDTVEQLRRAGEGLGEGDG